jgi:5-carboxymethyl-2-hydroxymuconic-semialdehyde dehydrogenase
MKKIASLNPAKNYEHIGEVIATSEKEIIQKGQNANRAKEMWRKVGVDKRIGYVKKIREAFKKREKDIAELITKEVGTPITECRDEVAWDFGYFDWFIENVQTAIATEILFEDKATSHKLYYEPLGSAAVITPWNLPFDLFIWGVIPNLLVGNTVIYKAAEECILTGKLFEQIINSCGLPAGVFSSIHGDAKEGEFLTNQPVDLIWFTGSSDVGKKLFELAGRKFIRSVMELGGSNPAIIFPDADIEGLIETVIFKRFSFCGQTCDADKRLIVHEKIFGEFLRKFKKRVESIIVGDPQDPKTQLGPLVSKKQLDILVSQVNDAKKQGAKIVTGGRQPDKLEGAYFLPTLIIGVKKNMRVWNEEVFGPVLPVVPFKTEKEAIDLANDTCYGLGSQIFTGDPDRISRVAHELKAGNVDVNGCGHFKPYVPFGGYKASGIGREHGISGFRELCQIKTISMTK